MKSIVSLFLLFFIMIIHAQEKILLKKGEITIPPGKKVILKPAFENDKVTCFEIVSDEDSTENKDLFDMPKNFKKDSKKTTRLSLYFPKQK